MLPAEAPNCCLRIGATLATWSMAACCIVGCVPHDEPAAGLTDAAMRQTSDGDVVDADVEALESGEFDTDSEVELDAWALPACGPSDKAALQRDNFDKWFSFGCGKKAPFALSDILDPLDIDCGGHELHSCALWPPPWSLPTGHPDWMDWGERSAAESDWVIGVQRQDGTTVELEPGADLWVIPIGRGISGGTLTNMVLSIGDEEVEGHKWVKVQYAFDIRTRVRCVGPLDDADGTSWVSTGNALWRVGYLKRGPMRSWPSGAGYPHTGTIVGNFFRLQCNRIVDIRFRFLSNDGKVWGEHIGKALLAWDDELP